MHRGPGAFEMFYSLMGNQHCHSWGREGGWAPLASLSFCFIISFHYLAMENWRTQSAVFSDPRIQSRAGRGFKTLSEAKEIQDWHRAVALASAKCRLKFVVDFKMASGEVESLWIVGLNLGGFGAVFGEWKSSKCNASRGPKKCMHTGTCSECGTPRLSCAWAWASLLGDGNPRAWESRYADLAADPAVDCRHMNGAKQRSVGTNWSFWPTALWAK